MVRWSGGLALVFVLTLAASVALGLPASAEEYRGVDSDWGAEPTRLAETTSTGAVTETELMAAPSEFVRTTHELTVYRNGSVRWTDRHVQPLNNESEIEAYRNYSERFNAERTDIYTQFRETASQLTARGTEATDRRMNATDFSRRAYVSEPGEGGVTLGHQGVVEMSFLWTNFTEQSGQRLRIGDVFTNGLALGPDVRFVITRSDALRFTVVEPAPGTMSGSNITTSRTITWSGEREFNPYRPLVRLAPPSTDRATNTTVAPDDGDGLPMWLPIVAVVIVVAGGAGAIWRLAQRRPDTTTDPQEAGAAEQASAGSSAVEPQEVLSDSERVKSLLDEHSGRMRQSEIVEATDWSKSKVSMLLSDMEDDDEITKLRVGRENIVSLPGHEPDAAGSPFEDEE
ncbi:helix-turn-helix transcriptional regulator [Halapricum desulfuricans]|uniref:HTH iclR-type domain-containing protein n=1 Tax=Halapricum desulfuricans TaxID=2841257 RepID=A0A897NU80_9EURY|nr:hypothetical protein [Halapricum desulfuricans]QSG14289.1 hypothetical protein HSEST_0745 [Halapricum desulfuricans]